MGVNRIGMSLSPAGMDGAEHGGLRRSLPRRRGKGKRMNPPSQALVDAVALALRNLPGGDLSWEEVARAAIAAVQANECCSQCGCALSPPTLCQECVAHEQKGTT